MKKSVLFILFIIAIFIFCGCAYPNSTISATNPVAPVSTATLVDAQDNGAFTLSQADFEKLKAPLTVMAITRESFTYMPLIYDLKNGLTKENIVAYAWVIAYYFDYFYPKDSTTYIETDKQRYFEVENQKYGIKKGDLYIDNKNKLHIPQKAINSILLSTFGKEALKGIDLNGNIYNDNGKIFLGAELEDGKYIFQMGEDYPEDNILGTLDLPVKANENAEFKMSFKKNSDYDKESIAHKVVNFDIMFKLNKDTTSEWGYHITAFNTTAPIITNIPIIPDPKAPIATVTPDAQATFTLTKADFEKLKAPIMVWALANEFGDDSNYDLKKGLTRENLTHYVWYIAYAFDYFDPSTPRYAEYFNADIEKYGIKKGDLKSTGNKLYIPQKAINSILLSTFGKEALAGIDLNENIFDGVDNYGPSRNLKDGIYIIGLGDDYPENDNLGPLDLPFTGNENTEFKIKYTVTYETAENEVDSYNIKFRLKKDDTSEWGYNITAFNMQKVE